MQTGKWEEWSNHVLCELKELRKENKELRKEQTKMMEMLHRVHTDFAILKVKTGLMGTAFGAIGGLLPSILEKLLHK